MAKPRTDERGIRSWIAIGIGITASVLGVAGFGWVAAVYVHKLNNSIESIAISADLARVKSVSDVLRYECEEKDREIDDLQSQVLYLSAKPTDDEWINQNHFTHELLSVVVKSARKLGKELEASSKDSNAERNVVDTSDIIKNLNALANGCGQSLTQLEQGLDVYFAHMEGAKLLSKLEIDGKACVAFTKHVCAAIEVDTGNIVEPTSQPTRSQEKSKLPPNPGRN